MTLIEIVILWFMAGLGVGYVFGKSAQVGDK